MVIHTVRFITFVSHDDFVSSSFTCVCFTQVGVYVSYVAVVPHITDAIQEWVERVANQPVSEDGTKPQVGEDKL